MTTDPLTFTSGVTLPDGRSIYVSIDVPRDHPSITGDVTEVLDFTEYAQMGAAHVLRTVRMGDLHRARRAAEKEVPF